MNGYIKLHRKITEWEWYSDVVTFRVFIHLLLIANHKQANYQGKTIEAGQAIISRKEVAKKLGLSEQSVRTALKHLKSTNEITTQITSKYTVVTIENWAKYQISDELSTSKSTNELTSDQPAANQQLTSDQPHLKNDKNVKNDKKDKKDKKYIYNIIPPAREEVIAYCMERKNSVNVDAFMDFYDSKGWYVGKNKMKDWRAAVRNWERHEKTSKPQSERRLDWIDEI